MTCPFDSMYLLEMLSLAVPNKLQLMNNRLDNDPEGSNNDKPPNEN